MRITLDKMPIDASVEEFIERYNKNIDLLNAMLCEIDEDNLSDSLLARMKEVQR